MMQVETTTIHARQQMVPAVHAGYDVWPCLCPAIPRGHVRSQPERWLLAPVKDETEEPAGRLP